MNKLQQHHIEYLLSQLEDDDFGIELSLQHITGQELLNQPHVAKTSTPHKHLHNIRPIHLLLPATLLQILVFVTAIVNFEHFASIFAAGNISIVGLALLPSTFQKRKSLVHWVS